MTVHAHKMVADLAVEMAQTVYEECAKNNEWRALNMNRNRFVKKLAPQLVDEARGTLASMLNSPGLPDADKERIFEALVLDHGVPRGGSSRSH